MNDTPRSGRRKMENATGLPLPDMWALDPEGYRCSAWWGEDGRSFDPVALLTGKGSCGAPAVIVAQVDDGEAPLAVCARHGEALGRLIARLGKGSP